MMMSNVIFLEERKRDGSWSSVQANITIVKAIGGVRGHFCKLSRDESFNRRGINAFCGMKIS